MGLLASKLTKSKFTQEDIEKVSREVVRRIISHSTPLKIYLFGSAASQTMSMVSDFDFALVFSDTVNLKKVKKDLLNLRLFPDINLDLLFSGLSHFEKKAKIGGVCWEIENRGKIVYDQRTKI